MSKPKVFSDKFERKAKAEDKINLRKLRESASLSTKYYIDEEDPIYVDKQTRRMPFNSNFKGK